LRENIRHRFEHRLEGRPYAGILIALVIGDQRAINATQWRLFGRTGITHLISISGLHVTLLAGLAYALINALWRRKTRLMLWLPAQRAATLGGFLVALTYCLLAGFAVPAQRTLYMLAVVALALWSGRTTSVSRVLALALLAVVLLDPWAVLMAGFWLSFGAVALLFFVGSGRLGLAQGVSAWLQAQWAVTIGTLPVLLLLFQQFSLVSPLANALAIPVVSFIVTPLALTATLPFLDFLLEPAHATMQALMHVIQRLAALPWAVWQQHEPPLWAWLGALAGCFWLLLPRGFPARWLGGFMLLPLFLAAPQRPTVGNVRLTVLDVGQGLAIHIQTAHHDLLYDTGPVYTAEANAGNRVVIPYLRAHGVNRLDGLIVTHQDTDHSGGAEAVVDEVPVGWLMSSLEFEHPISALPVKALPCSAGQQWNWDGVHFRVLHPLAVQLQEESRKTNDLSCVLMVENAKARMLLTSDIEALSERALLDREGGQLHADVLVAPHHGSRTSSTPEFIAAVAARTVIFPVGYRNHFHHPRPEILERYRASGAHLYRTDTEGALTVRLSADHQASEPPIYIESARTAHPRYWHGR
jgi:competence protein ComEC